MAIKKIRKNPKTSKKNLNLKSQKSKKVRKVQKKILIKWNPNLFKKKKNHKKHSHPENYKKG